MTNKRGLKLNLGAGKSSYRDCINVDRVCFPGINVISNFDGVALPFASNSFAEIRIEHTLEHIHDFMGLMQEIHRVGINGGSVLIRVPYHRYEGAFHDPTHVHFFGERTFDIFQDDYEYNYYTSARFDVIKVALQTTQKTTKSSMAKRIMSVPLPFRRLLNNFFWNMYSEISYELRVLKG